MVIEILPMYNVRLLKILTMNPYVQQTYPNKMEKEKEIQNSTMNLKKHHITQMNLNNYIFTFGR
jgi:hypothetical protein